MKGIEAKYTAKHIAKMIKRNRKIHSNNRRYYECFKDSFTNCEVAADKNAIANHVEKETNRLSLEFRAFMIHNAYMKNRKFTSAEVKRYNLGNNYLEEMKHNLGEYSRYMGRKQTQDKAIQIVKYNMLNSEQDREQFEKWVESSSS
ncbi:MAG: hypothetical protein ACOCQD_01735 [archaeon]